MKIEITDYPLSNGDGGSTTVTTGYHKMQERPILMDGSLFVVGIR